MVHKSFTPFIRRFFQYSLVGGSTFLLDLFLIYLLKTLFSVPDGIAVGIGFTIAVSVNFLISYYWVFRGTEQKKVSGYLNFMAIAVLGLLVVVNATLFIKDTFTLDIYVARTIVACGVGIMNYVLNAVFNFKMIS